MKSSTTLTLVLAATLCTGTAIAGSCPLDMRQIDAAMKASTLSAQDMARVEALREKGERLHRSGDHAASVVALSQAKELLGI